MKFRRRDVRMFFEKAVDMCAFSEPQQVGNFRYVFLGVLQQDFRFDQDTLRDHFRRRLTQNCSYRLVQVVVVDG